MRIFELLLQNPTLNKKNAVFTLHSPFDLVLQTADQPVMQAWQDSFRTFDWKAAFPTPELSIRYIQELCALV